MMFFHVHLALVRTPHGPGAENSPANDKGNAQREPAGTAQQHPLLSGLKTSTGMLLISLQYPTMSSSVDHRPVVAL